jgi:hypothetical protein
MSTDRDKANLEALVGKARAEGKTLFAVHLETVAELERVRELLSDIEWQGYNGMDACPSCGGYAPYKMNNDMHGGVHEDGCPLKTEIDLRRPTSPCRTDPKSNG